MTNFERVTKARTVTGEAIKTYALARHELEQIRSDRAAAAEDIFQAAHRARAAEAAVTDAIQSECDAVVAAERALDDVVATAAEADRNEARS